MEGEGQGQGKGAGRLDMVGEQVASQEHEQGAARQLIRTALQKG